MSFIEKLLQGIDARFDEEQERSRREIAAGIARIKDEDAITKERERELQEGSYFDPKERQRLKRVLERFSVKERLEAIRDGVWKAGEVQPYYVHHISGGEPVIYKPPVLSGYELEYRYPAVVHTKHPIAAMSGVWGRHEGNAVSGVSYGFSGGAVIHGFTEGENIDHILIAADFNQNGVKDSVWLSAASRLAVDSFENIGGLLPDSESNKLPKSVDLMRFNAEEAYGYLHPEAERFIAGFWRIKTPVILEELLVDWCYELTNRGRLPLQSQKTNEEVRREVVRKNDKLLSSLKGSGFFLLSTLE